MASSACKNTLPRLPAELKFAVYKLAAGQRIESTPWRIIVNIVTEEVWLDECIFRGRMTAGVESNASDDGDPALNATCGAESDSNISSIADDDDGEAIEQRSSTQIGTDKDVPNNYGDEEIARGETAEESEDDVLFGTFISLASTSRTMRDDLVALRGSPVKLFFQPPTTASFTNPQLIPWNLATYILNSASSVEWDILDVEQCLSLRQVERATLYSIAGDAFALEMTNGDTGWEVEWDESNPLSKEEDQPYPTEAMKEKAQGALQSIGFTLKALKVLEKMLIGFAKTHLRYSELMLASATG